MKIRFDQGYNDIGVEITSYFTCSRISRHWELFFLSSNSRVDVREVKAKSIRALSRYFGMKVFMVRNITVKIGQSWCLAVICRKWSALPFEMQFQLIAISVFLKTCVKEVHSLIFKRLSPAFDHQHHLVTWWGRWHKSEGHSVTCYCHLTISTAFGARWTTGN